MSAEQKVALVTGASRGLGRGIAEHLAQAGYAVVGCGRTPETGKNIPFEYQQVDVTEEAQVIQMVRNITKNYGRLDAVINNAGVAAMNPALLMPLAAARKIVETNFLGAFLICRESAKIMMRRQYGRIVNLSSVAVPMDLEGEAVYAATKAALEKFTKIFAHEVGQYGITVNAVGPSPVETDLIRKVPKDKIESLVQRLAIKRMGSVEDVARVIDFYLSPSSDFITGQVIYLGGAG